MMAVSVPMRQSQARRLIVVSVAIGVALSVSLVASRQNEAQRTAEEQVAEIMAVLRAYADGDDLAVLRWTETKLAFRIVGVRGADKVAARKDVPARIRAAFLLELLAGGARLAAPSLLKLGRTIFEEDAKPFGVNPDADRFEVLWHQTAVAIAQRFELFAPQVRHLDEIWPRFEAARRRGVMPATRLPLARAVAAAGLCCPDALPGVPLGGVLYREPETTNRGTLQGALVLFEEAAAIPALEVEARIRAGVLLFGASREKQAIEWLERIPAHDDETLGYVQHLTLGHAYEAVDRLPEAAAAYARARTVMPTAQSAAIGEAAVLLRLGRAEDALRVADAARRDTLVSATLDPRQIFRAGDTLFIDEWLAEIRRMRR
jgi:tetratricopeptide (TPR) repeat protein